MKILLVDDSKAIHSLMEEMFSELTKITFQHVFNGKQALDAVSDESFQADLVLLDWEMPEMTGIEALPLLRKAKPSLPIMMMTSKNSINDMTNALDKGATEYTMKPFTKDILIGKIKQILGEECLIK